MPNNTEITIQLKLQELLSSNTANLIKLSSKNNYWHTIKYLISNSLFRPQ